MKSLKWLAALVLAFGVASVGAQDKKAAGTLSKEDQEHLKHMAAADMAEVEAGKVASQKASNPEVKKYAEKMVQEHSKMLDEGKKLAEKKGVKEEPRADGKHKQNLADLQKKSGDDFDREYVTQMVQDHEGAMKLGEKVAKEAKDPEIKAHAQKASPHIKQHLDEARSLRASLAASAGGTAKKK